MNLSAVLSQFRKSDADSVRAMQFHQGMHRLSWMMLVVQRGGNIHGVNHKATLKRRAANRVARRQRKVNAHK